MQDAVVIKSFPNGISIQMDSEVDFEIILQEIAEKFSKSRSFFGTSSMALSLGGRTFSDAEEMQILDAIHKNSNLSIPCIVGKDEATNRQFIKALAYTKERISGSANGQFHKGSLKNKEVLETDESVIILGDVCPGCAVISAGSILVLGGLYGEAYAGGSKNKDAFVAALEMEPERICIGDVKYKPSKQPKWSIHQKFAPKLAREKNGKIVFEGLTRELLLNF